MDGHGDGSLLSTVLALRMRFSFEHGFSYFYPPVFQ